MKTAINYNFHGKTAFVSGGASGLGLGCAERLSEAGAKVAIADIDKTKLEAVKKSLEERGTSVLTLCCDVSDAQQVDNALQTVIDHWGSLNIGINCAGISSELAPVADTKEADFDRVLSVNLKGVWLCMRSQLRQMQKQNEGSIVNIASVLSNRVFSNASFYVASKFAVAGLTRTAAVEYAQSGIRINAVCPGVIETPLIKQAMTEGRQSETAAQHPMNRLGTVEEVAEAVMWLCSDQASFNTGTLLAVDGGWSAT